MTSASRCCRCRTCTSGWWTTRCSQPGVIINYAESFDKVARTCGEVRPTIVLSVPRLYEKVYARVLENALSGSALKRRSSSGRKRAGDDWATLTLAGRPIPAGLALQHAIADRLVFSKLRARTGGRIRFFISGSAPLSPEIAKFFFSAGLPVLEGYGLTETSPVLTLNPLDPAQDRHGGSGRPGGAAQDRGGRRDPGQGPERHAGLLQQARGDGGGDRRRGMVPHGRHRRAGRRRLPQDHRPQEGPDQDRRRQVHRAAADRESGQAQQVRRQRRDAGRPAQVLDHARRAELRGAGAAGPPPRACASGRAAS